MITYSGWVELVGYAEAQQHGKVSFEVVQADLEKAASIKIKLRSKMGNQYDSGLCFFDATEMWKADPEGVKRLCHLVGNAMSHIYAKGKDTKRLELLRALGIPDFAQGD